MPFTIQIVWGEGKDHIMDCYFSMINLKGINCKNQRYVQYTDVPSDKGPMPHDPDLPVPELGGNIEYNSNSEVKDMTSCWR